ncbi:MAG: ATP-dependent Clp protease adaptor ClpS [Leptospiraceae bacterium]|nr:ATP-dependent Clp protease adaptor ClpS [Leptospiraceae bacterium]MCP5494420.1 ATP-dependent Clp protease adaptor ClpS [Leptospiraceae bacterium]
MGSAVIESTPDIEYRQDISNIYANKVILYNDDFNSFYHVEKCLVKICCKSKAESKRIALEAHNNGKAVCYTGSMEACETVAEKMGEANLTVSIE